MSQITTHVLDVSVGRPAANVPVMLEIQNGGQWKALGSGKSDTDGRMKGLLGSEKLELGTYRLTFNAGAYFSERQVHSLYPHISIVFEVRNVQEHYHIPLLLSPFGYSTYRGS